MYIAIFIFRRNDMKKIGIPILLLLVILSANAQSDVYPPQGWNADFAEAVEKAQAEDKWLLLNFTGSDWCIWCKRLSESVFTTDEFQKWAEENAVLVFLDFPSSFELSEAQQMQNSYLQQFMGVQGYPTIWMLDSDLTPLLSTGYKDRSAESYIRHLEIDRVDIPRDDLNSMRQQFQDFLQDYIEPLDL